MPEACRKVVEDDFWQVRRGASMVLDVLAQLRGGELEHGRWSIRQVTDVHAVQKDKGGW